MALWHPKKKLKKQQQQKRNENFEHEKLRILFYDGIFANNLFCSQNGINMFLMHLFIYLLIYLS